MKTFTLIAYQAYLLVKHYITHRCYAIEQNKLTNLYKAHNRVELIEKFIYKIYSKPPRNTPKRKRTKGTGMQCGADNVKGNLTD